MEGVLEKTSSDGTAHLGRWRVWLQNEDRYIEVSYRTSTERALLTLRSVSNEACHREAERLFSRLTRRKVPGNGLGLT